MFVLVCHFPLMTFQRLINFYSLIIHIVIHFTVCRCLGVETKFKGAFYEVLLSVSHVPELSRVQEEEGGLVVGAAVTLNTLTHHLTSAVDRLPGYSYLLVLL